MDYSKLLFLLLLVGAITASPTSKENAEDEKVIITKDIYSKKFLLYTGKHDIVNILVPTNSFNFNDNTDFDLDDFESQINAIFFVEAQLHSDGRREDKGLYILKNGEATKLLEHGRDAAASSDDSKDIFFGAQDGIYIYDAKDNKAVKYGTVNDDIIALVKENNTDVIYYLNKDHDLYKVTENGHKAVKVNEVVGAQEIVLDGENNLFYYTADKQTYVLRADGVKKIEGLPENPKSVKLIKPLALMEEGIFFLSDNVYYLISSNGTSESTTFSIHTKAKPTAYSMEATIIQYFGHHKKIYKYNLLKLVFGESLKELTKFLKENESKLQSITR